MSITIPASSVAPGAVDDEVCSASIEILDVGRDRISQVDDIELLAETPPLDLDFRHPTGHPGEPVWSVWASRNARAGVWWLRRATSLGAAFVLGATSALMWPAASGDDSPSNVLIAGVVQVSGGAREVRDGELVVPAVVPVHNSGTFAIDVLSVEPNGWPVDPLVARHQQRWVYPGQWRTFPVGFTVDCRTVPPLTTSLDVRVAGGSGDESISVRMPSDTRKLVAAWEELCPSSPYRQEVP